MHQRAKNRTRKRLAIWLLLVLGGIAVGYYVYRQQQKPKEALTEPYTVTQLPASFAIRQRGILETTDREPAIVRTRGYIQEIVEQGTSVKKGDFIFRMDDSDPRENLDQLQDSIEKEMLSQQISTAQLELTRYREEQEMSVLGAGLAHAQLEEKEELGQPTEEDRRLSAIDKRLAELDLEEAKDNYERQLRLFQKGFLSKTALEPFEKRVRIAEAFLEETNRKIEIEAEGISEERRIELRRAVERAEAFGSRARRRMERRIKEIEEQLRASDQRISQTRHRMTREQEEIDGAEVRAGRDGIVKVRQYRDWRSGGKLLEYKAGVQKYPLDIIADVINPRNMTIRLVVNEADFHRIHEGMPVKVSLPAFPGRTFNGSVSQLGAIGQERNRVDPTAKSGGESEIVMFRAAIAFDGEGMEFRPGMSALVDIIVEEETSRLVIPRQSVDLTGEKPAVWIGNGDALRRREISGRPFNQQYFLVEKGLQEGDVIRIPVGSPTSLDRFVRHTGTPRSEEQTAIP